MTRYFAHWIIYLLKPNRIFAHGINRINRIIQAIGEHVVAKNTLAGGGVGVGVEEAADCGVVISALQIIEPGFLGFGMATGHLFN